MENAQRRLGVVDARTVEILTESGQARRAREAYRADGLPQREAVYQRCIPVTQATNGAPGATGAPCAFRLTTDSGADADMNVTLWGTPWLTGDAGAGQRPLRWQHIVRVGAR